MDIPVCAVIPAFNEQSTVARLVEETARYVDRIFLVDDGSTDKTASLAEYHGANVIRIPQCRGKGNALRVGFRIALEEKFDIVISLDADFQHDPSEIPRFIRHYELHGPEIIVGNRMSTRGEIPRVRYGPNKIGNYAFSWLIRQPIEDSQCGFRLYDHRVLRNIRTLKDGFEAEADILLKAGKSGYNIDFIPIQAIYFGKDIRSSNYRPITDTFRISIVFLRNLFWKDS